MKVLLIGAGGREHTIAWKLAKSPKLKQLYTLPGNPGTAQHGINLSGDMLDAISIVAHVQELGIDLVVIGPEAPLAAGLADALQAAGVLVFGPSQAGAQLEASKAFAKDFMRDFDIPTARYVIFEHLDAAQAHLGEIDYPYVIKASGLAAGKGVFLPDNDSAAKMILQQIMQEHRFGAAGKQVVIEERLSGPEVSVLVFTDGEKLSIMPPAQDHKRLLDNDEGPNTGGMGVFAPSPYATPELVEQITAEIIQPTLAGLRAQGIDYKGVLYFGLMLTVDGPKLLEYNCRFGDPETQVILPLLKSDLLEIMLGVAQGALPSVEWEKACAVCVVLASGGYPEEYEKGIPITGLGCVTDSLIFHAGTREQDDQIVTAGGRVLGVTAVGDTLAAAAQAAYQEISKIYFNNMHYRSDIGASISAYARAGVDIRAANRATKSIKNVVEPTLGQEVLSGIGQFGGLFDAAALQHMAHPVLVASTDGVGTKVILAAQYGQLFGIGQDIVNHCINDILVQAARPLFFLDYFAASKLEVQQVTEVIGGMAAACEAAGCALLGGETAEMPGVYHEGHFDVAGTIVGVVEYDRVLPKTDIKVGDVLIGLSSSGPHTNGYSLIREIFADVDLKHVYPELDQPLYQALLASHRSYFAEIWPVLQDEPCLIKAMAHITGGGFIDNIPRVLPDGLSVVVDISSWDVPPLFKLIQRLGAVAEMEMYQVYNMGIGMVIITSAQHTDELISALGMGQPIGQVIAGNKVQLVR